MTGRHISDTKSKLTIKQMMDTKEAWLVMALVAALITAGFVFTLLSKIIPEPVDGIYQSKISERLQIIETQRISFPNETVEAFSMPIMQGKVVKFPTLEPSDKLPTVDEIKATVEK